MSSTTETIHAIPADLVTGAIAPPIHQNVNFCAGNNKLNKKYFQKTLSTVK